MRQKIAEGKCVKILIYGAGVIGSLYAALFAEAGFPVTVLARGRRLAELQSHGLRYDKDGKTETVKVSVIDKLENDDEYDFIFLPVRAEQLHGALRALRENSSPNIVTMTNTIEDYTLLEQLCGEGRLLPAFPGAGGSMEHGVLHASLTPKIVQPTTFGEIHGEPTERLRILAALFRRSRIPYQIVPNMHYWQLSHLGMVVPIADAYYRSGSPETVYREKEIMRGTAEQMKANFSLLAKRKMLSPFKFQLLRLCPTPIFTAALSMVFKSNFGNRFMYQHAMKAPGEMRKLHEDFYGYVKNELHEEIRIL